MSVLEVDLDACVFSYNKGVRGVGGKMKTLLVFKNGNIIGTGNVPMYGDDCDKGDGQEDISLKARLSRVMAARPILATPPGIFFSISSS